MENIKNSCKNKIISIDLDLHKKPGILMPILKAFI